MSFGFGILLVLALAGFVGMLVGVVYSNYAVQQMRIVLNQERAPDNQLNWYDAIQYVAQDVMDSYTQSFPNGPLSRKLKIGYYAAGIGGVVMIASAFLMKYTD